jgi:hypothetical protein
MFMHRWHWKRRLVAGASGFLLGLLFVLTYNFLVGRFSTRHARGLEASNNSGGCVEAADGLRPEEILGALESAEVGVRREMFRRLSLEPGASANFYDFARDKDFPERAEEARLQYVNLDETPADEALITFVRWENPAAIVLQRSQCGWRVVSVLSSWLRFADYPYRDWLELPQLFRTNQHAILLRDSDGDATEYTRNVRVLKLDGGRLEQVAEFTEESIQPLEAYRDQDWPEVKRRRTRRAAFVPETGADAARIRFEYADEVVKYAGVAPTYSYWRAGDGAWHRLPAHWRNRPVQKIKTLDRRAEQLTWNEQQKRFVAVDN